MSEVIDLWVGWGVSYGVVWCGVVWCGVVWCGVVWCGVVWCGGEDCVFNVPEGTLAMYATNKEGVVFIVLGGDTCESTTQGSGDFSVEVGVEGSTRNCGVGGSE